MSRLISAVPNANSNRTARSKTPNANAPTDATRTKRSLTDICICLGLFIATIIVYFPARHFEFVNYDDPVEVTHNYHLRNQTTFQAVETSFTSTVDANWFPLTQLSHMLDYRLFGSNSGGHHLTNILLHALATVLLFTFLNESTGNRWPSAFVAAVFGLHPLHVESVAWVTERKDVLSTFFALLALNAYARYAKRPTRSRYWLTFLFFCMGLMSKAMLITFPFLLILLDVWPLGRIALSSPPFRLNRTLLTASFREKLPFFAAAGITGVIAYVAQNSAGALAKLSSLDPGLRVKNALVSYVAYIGKTFWPTHLAVFYPYPADVPVSVAALSALLLLGISLTVLRFRERPYLAVGWFWFLGTLGPVIGLVQTGSHARADRYMYLPMLGVTIAVAWTVSDFVQQRSVIKIAVGAVAVACCGAFAFASCVQLQYWRNSESLFEHALEVTTDNYIAHANLAAYLVEKRDRLPDVIAHAQAALRIRPNFVPALETLGLAYAEMGRPEDAVTELRGAIAQDADSSKLHNDLGNALSQISGRLPDAVAEYETALKLDPVSPDAHNSSGAAFLKLGRLPEAISEFEAAVRLDPDYVDAHSNLGFALLRVPNRLTQAIAECQTAVRLKPDSPEAHNNLGLAFAHSPDRLPDAISEYQAALARNFNFPEAHFNLGAALARWNRLPEAMQEYKLALQERPNYGNAHYALGVALQKAGRVPEAITEYEAALRIGHDPQLQEIVNGLLREQK